MSDGGNSNGRVLILEDDRLSARALSERLRSDGHETCVARDAQAALRQLQAARDDERHPYHVLISTTRPVGMACAELLADAHSHQAGLSIILIAPFGTIDEAMRALRGGAMDYLTKPVDVARLSSAVGTGVKVARNREAERQAAARGTGGVVMGGMVGNDPRMEKVYNLVEAVAPTGSTLLITGESGTGKSMIARAVHDHSPRREGPFVTFSCGAIPETLLESELFGHVRGAFTGADTDRPGKIRAAEGGTLFIDEINSATPALQLKLLRVLHERVYEPVGTHKPQSADVRFITATNEPLPALIKAGRFREDLYYRINVVTVDLPPLRHRDADIRILANHFLAISAKKIGKTIKSIDPGAMSLLVRYGWPGNVRELQNAIERAVVLARRDVIEEAGLPDTIREHAGGGATGFVERRNNTRHNDRPWSPQPLKEALADPEKRILLAALKHRNWNRQQTAADLNIDRTTLYKKIKQHRLEELAGG